jgi:hypothetical protein
LDGEGRIVAATVNGVCVCERERERGGDLRLNRGPLRVAILVGQPLAFGLTVDLVEHKEVRAAAEPSERPEAKEESIPNEQGGVSVAKANDASDAPDKCKNLGRHVDASFALARAAAVLISCARVESVQQGHQDIEDQHDEW